MKGRPFIHFVCNIAICDCITALTYSWGFLPKGSFICKMQGFLSIFFSRASWLWTDVLISQLYFFIVYKELWLTMPAMHGIVWFFSIVLQVIPFLDINYGTWDDELSIPNNQLCFYSTNNNDSAASNYARYAYFLILTLSFVYILVFSLLISCKHRQQSEIWKRLILYPLGLFIAWIPNAIYNWYASYYTGKDELPPHYFAIDNYLVASNSLYGIILSIFFYSQNADARMLLWHFIKQKILCFSIGSHELRIQMRASDISEKSVAKVSDITSSSYNSQGPIPISTTENVLRIV